MPPSAFPVNPHTPDIWTVQNLLSPEECAQLIQKGETIGFNPASVRMRGGPQMRTDDVFFNAPLPDAA